MAEKLVKILLNVVKISTVNAIFISTTYTKNIIKNATKQSQRFNY